MQPPSPLKGFDKYPNQNIEIQGTLPGIRTRKIESGIKIFYRLACAFATLATLKQPIKIKLSFFHFLLGPQSRLPKASWGLAERDPTHLLLSSYQITKSHLQNHASV